MEVTYIFFGYFIVERLFRDPYATARTRVQLGFAGWLLFAAFFLAAGYLVFQTKHDHEWLMAVAFLGFIVTLETVRCVQERRRRGRQTSATSGGLL